MNPIPFPRVTIALAVEDVDRCLSVFKHELDAALRQQDPIRVHECETVIATLTNLRNRWVEEAA